MEVAKIVEISVPVDDGHIAKALAGDQNTTLVRQSKSFWVCDSASWDDLSVLVVTTHSLVKFNKLLRIDLSRVESDQSILNPDIVECAASESCLRIASEDIDLVVIES